MAVPSTDLKHFVFSTFEYCCQQLNFAVIFWVNYWKYQNNLQLPVSANSLCWRNILVAFSWNNTKNWFSCIFFQWLDNWYLLYDYFLDKTSPVNEPGTMFNEYGTFYMVSSFPIVLKKIKFISLSSDQLHD